MMSYEFVWPMIRQTLCYSVCTHTLTTDYPFEARCSKVREREMIMTLPTTMICAMLMSVCKVMQCKGSLSRANEDVQL